jgi:hypothetical protein
MIVTAVDDDSAKGEEIKPEIALASFCYLSAFVGDGPATPTLPTPEGVFQTKEVRTK